MWLIITEKRELSLRFVSRRTCAGIYDGEWVVKSGHDTFAKVYDRYLQGKLLTPPDVTDNVIRIEKIGGNPEVDYDHAPPFQMLKIGVYDEGGENDGAKREVN
jgi:hypothetical protein